VKPLDLGEAIENAKKKINEKSSKFMKVGEDSGSENG